MKVIDYAISAISGSCLTLLIIWMLGGSIAQQPTDVRPVRIPDMSKAIPMGEDGELLDLDQEETERARRELFEKAEKYRRAGYVVVNAEAVYGAPEGQYIQLSFTPSGATEVEEPQDESAQD